MAELNLWWDRMVQKLQDATEKAPIHALCSYQWQRTLEKREWDGSMPTISYDYMGMDIIEHPPYQP